MLTPRARVASRLVFQRRFRPDALSAALMRQILLLSALVGALAAPAAAQPSAPAAAAAKGEEVSIPFPGFRIRNFRAESRDVVFLEDQRRNWYRAELIGPCTELPWAHAIGIDTRGSGSFDRFSAILVRGDRCQLTSLTRSEKPAKKAKKRAA